MNYQPFVPLSRAKCGDDRQQSAEQETMSILDLNFRFWPVVTVELMFPKAASEE